MATLTRTLTYAQLVAEIAAETLHIGESIKISDYVTKHNIYDGTSPLEEVHTDTVEPLIVTALTNSVISNEAKSALFPDDVIFYDVTNSLCEDGITARKGKITYRKDVTRNIETWYDFRGVVFRRWKFDLSGFTAWVSEGTFTRGDKITYNNKLFYCTNSITGSTDNPEILTANFNYVTDNQRWLSWQTDDVALGGDPVVEDAIYIPVDDTASQDFYTFSDATGAQESDWFKDMSILQSQDVPNNNIVFIETAPDRTHSISFGENCFFMTFGDSNFSNTFGNDNNSNIFGNYNSYNTFGDNNFSNTFGNDNNSNIFGNYNYSNTFGDNNFSNTFGNGNSSNTFGNGNSYNTFGNGNLSNTFGNYNSYNTFGNDNNSNIFGDGNSYNTFGNLDQNNVFTGIVIIKNTFKNSIDGTGIDYSEATHLIGDYDCEISRRVDGTAKLTYINNSDVITIVAVNA